MELVARAVQWLPEGGTLPRTVLTARHRGILLLLWLHVPALAALALLRGYDAVHAAVDVLPVLVLALMASRRPHDARSRRVLATLGLFTSSAAAVHLTGGLVEAHFHFFIVLAVVSLYQCWHVFLLAIGFVVVHHSVVGLLVHDAVFQHSAAQAHPVRWALLHATLVLAAAAAHVVAWRSGEQGSHDSLTGVASAGLLVRQLELALERGPVAVVYLDLDGFKQVNDRLGHRAGDRLLASAARRMEAAVREGDRVGRLGGDEFAVLLPGTTADEAAVIAQRLVGDLARPFDLPEGTARVGASAGVAAAGSGAPAEQLLSAADAAMYDAKRAGKGRWALAGV